MTYARDIEVTGDGSGPVQLTIRREEDGGNTTTFTVTLSESDARRLVAQLSGYNGWSNYETWSAHLWLTNDEHTYQLAREAAAMVTYQGSRHDEDTFVDIVERAAYAAFRDPDSPAASLGSDYIQNALTAVDYRELVAAFQEE
jgi:hypothetical protein